jgi:hypothetical protein
VTSLADLPRDPSRPLWTLKGAGKATAWPFVVKLSQQR